VLDDAISVEPRRALAGDNDGRRLAATRSFLLGVFVPDFNLDFSFSLFSFGLSLAASYTMPLHKTINN
jgi:hypothetical protein